MDRKSTSGFVAMLNGDLVVWSLKKQASTLLSSTEAKFIALTFVTQKLIWLRGLLSSINHLSRTATPVMECFEPNIFIFLLSIFLLILYFFFFSFSFRTIKKAHDNEVT